MWGGGYVGNGTTTGSLTPVQVSNLTDVKGISAGLDYSSALKTNGTIWTWGVNDYGKLGDGTTINRLAPVQVTGLP